MHLFRIPLLFCLFSLLHATYAEDPIKLITVENLVEFSTDRGQNWTKAETGDRLDYGFRVRTGEFSRATLRYPSGNVIRLGEFSRITLAETRGSENNGDKPFSVELKEGALYFLSRKKENEADVVTPTVNAAIRGTEFEIRVLPDQSTEISLFEGEVDLSNSTGQLRLQSGERARTVRNAAPQRLPALEASSYMQWYLYYPGILDTRGLRLHSAYQTALDAYDRGDLLAALEQLPPAGAAPTSEAHRLFEAAVILASGQIDAALARVDPTQDTRAAALKELVAAVKGDLWQAPGEPAHATGWMARSYSRQAQGDLSGARAAVQRAVDLSPEFGYAWARLARLHFSFGNIPKMRRALEQALAHSPSNPEAYVLKGFEHAASGQTLPAAEAFARAIELAPNYPEAWLGQGLIGFNRGEEEAALQDLIAAAILLPNSSILRSYLAKGFAENHDVPLPWQSQPVDPLPAKALHELELAKQLDPADPTPWLYAALIKRNSLRYNEALADLQQSIDLNDNRSLFRSTSLLDEDIAVRRSNLADIYQEAGLPTQALAEAGKAVQRDYTNFAAHDFLARVYRQSFDETNINQRNDNALANEFFLRNIFAPVGAGIASQRVSNQEYGSLFNARGFSGTVEARYDSREHFNTTGFFTYQGSNYEVGVELEHQDWDTLTINDDFQSTTAQLHFKFEPSTQDRFYSLLVWSETEQGDLRSLPNPDAVNGTVRDITIADGSDPFFPAGTTVFSPATVSNYPINAAYGRDPEFESDEAQEPLFFSTYARTWNEAHTSLFLYGWADTQRTTADPLTVVSSSNTTTDPAAARVYQSSYEIEQDFDLHTFELQHIWKQERSQLIAGARFQTGELEDDITTRAAVSESVPDFLLPTIIPFAVNIAGSGTTEEDFERLAVYTQFSHEISERHTLILGFKYDYMEYVDGLGSIPRSGQSQNASQLSPQLGFLWQLEPNWLLRGAYARTMSGFQLEERLRLEPTNIAGLTTSFASIAPSQIIGNVPGGTIDTLELALNGKLSEATFFSANAAYGKFEADRSQGRFSESIPLGTFPNDPMEIVVSKIDQEISYEEFSIRARIDHLLNARISIGASLYWQHARIDERLDSPFAVNPTSPYVDDTQANLYIGSLYARFQDPSGWFAQTDLQYWVQTNHSIEPDIENESAPNLNLAVGYRLQKQKGEVRLGILNLTDEQYRLNPVNHYAAPPQERTFVIESRFSF